MKKQNEIDRDALAQRIRVLDGLSADDKSALLELLNQKKYGLVWENKPENVEEELRTHIPVLEEVKERFVSSDNPDAPNHILIEGDNLQALTTFAYTHEGKIDVIYIDPPYNTGNKDFVYNDSFVDSEDSYRHSKWLSFMEKRLRIARRLLSDKGVIFISIDDNEQANLKLLCDEVFGEVNNYSNFVWVNSQKETLDDDTKFAGANLGKIKKSFEYILVFCKEGYQIKPDPGTSKYIDKLITNGSNTISSCVIPKGVECIESITKTIKGRVGGSNDYYDIMTEEGMIIVDGILQNDVLIQGPLRNANTLTRFFNGEIIFDHKGQQLERVFLSKNGMLNTRKIRVGNTPSTVLVGKGTAKNGTLLLKEIFSGKSPFEFCKPIELIKYLLSKHKNNNSTILDFFAGSGTTLHATMQLNAEDGGHRQCILVTNNENGICENVTYERNRRVIQGYTDAKGKQVEGLTDNNLRYYKVNLVDRENSSENRMKLMQACTDLLCIKENIYNETAFGPKMVRPQFLRFFANNNGDALLIIFIVDSRLVEYVNETVSALPDNGKRIKTYVYSENDYPYSDDFAPVASRLELVAMPAAMRNALRNVLPDPHKTPVLDEEENTAPNGEINFNDLSQN